jgi:hypothetical protein
VYIMLGLVVLKGERRQQLDITARDVVGYRTNITRPNNTKTIKPI